MNSTPVGVAMAATELVVPRSIPRATDMPAKCYCHPPGGVELLRSLPAPWARGADSLEWMRRLAVLMILIGWTGGARAQPEATPSVAPAPAPAPTPAPEPALSPALTAALAPTPRLEPTPEPWYRGAHGRNRVFHLTVSVGLGVAYVASESVLKPALAPDTCRWCAPPGLDDRIRRALVWDDYDRARSLSNLTGYVAAPALTLGVTALAALWSEDAGWARLIDDTIPILETVAISQAVTQIVKFSVGRARPLVYFRAPPADTDDNLSFFSGHSALAFGLTFSAGMLARWRGSRIEPVIWAGGLALSVTTAYLRIAADKHYFTDVALGSAVGIAAGLTLPRLMRRYRKFSIVPSAGGLSVAGTF